MKPPLQNISLLGVDMAWGDRNPDGLCAIQIRKGEVVSVETALTHGDEALVDWCCYHSSAGTSLVTLDAPIVCPNLSGCRPVDKLTHVLFGRYKAGCYPANLGKCPRPPRIAELLSEHGFEIGWDLKSKKKLLAEVYPHPAMVRVFNLSERIPYKKGKVAEKQAGFKTLQKHMRRYLRNEIPELGMPSNIRKLLSSKWSKGVEDQTDAFFCALIALNHWRSRGNTSEVIGDLETGFILLPA